MWEPKKVTKRNLAGGTIKVSRLSIRSSSKKREPCAGRRAVSFPEVYDFVERASEIWVKAKDENGKDFEVHADGLFAVCLQHEMDHIDGIVFFKRMSRLKADRIKTKMLKRGNINVEV